MPDHKILVIISLVDIEGFGETAHLCSLNRAITVRPYTLSLKGEGLVKIRYLAPLDSCACMLKDWLVICDEYQFLVAGQLVL